MNWKELSKNEAQSICEPLISEGGMPSPINDTEYLELKLLISQAFNKALDILNITNEDLFNSNVKYKFDCYFGKEIYKIFTNGKYFIGDREASNDDMWRYIQVKIIPELIYFRWKDNVTPRLYAQSNRLYLKTLWWYYYLSFNFDLDYTCEMLLNPCNSTDTIVALVERCGRNGYRLDVYREIMKQKTSNSFSTDEFRKMMVINSAKINVVNPYLLDGGISKYVEDLVNSVKGGF